MNQANTAPVGPTSIEQLTHWGRSQLAEATFEVPARESVLLLARILGRGEASVLARGEESVPDAVVERYRDLLERRVSGEPFAYLFGEREFFGRPFAVDSRVLIPRPETEHLVEAVLALDLPDQPRLLDIGTGSGCIAVTLALELPRARVVATDLSLGALSVAAQNVRRHGVEDRVSLLRCDLCSALEISTFDAVASNPPYFPTFTFNF